MPYSHLGDEGITNILSDVLIESQGQKTTIGDTTYDELTLLAVAGLIAEQQSPCPAWLLFLLPFTIQCQTNHP